MLELEGFKTKNFVEQIQILNEIGNGEPTPEMFRRLFEIYLAPLGDKPVDAMVQHVLSGLLSKDEAETVKGLTSPNEKIKRLCLQITGRRLFQSAANLLLKMAAKEKEPVIVHEIFVTMSKLKNPAFLNFFSKHIRHPEDLNAAIAIKMVGEYNETGMKPELFRIVEESELEDRFETCSLPTAQSLETLAVFGGTDVIEFFISRLHHKNPSVRRIIQEELVRIGEPVVPYVEIIFNEGSVDDKIMASNLLGAIGERMCGEVLIAAMDSGKAADPNVRFAIYEAFGNIKFMKGLVCLMDGLAEEDPFFLICVINSLNRQLNPFVSDKIKERVLVGDGQAQRILQAVSAAHALDIFSALYRDAEIGRKLIDIIAQSRDPEVITAFSEKLQTLEGEQVQSHLQILRSHTGAAAGPRILAVDDSRSMLSFYRKVLSDRGYTVVTAANGREALELMELQEPFSLVISDMNMPVMDGIELARKVKDDPLLQNIPFIMITTESDTSQQQLACSVGVNDFIIKPLTAEKFIAKVQQKLPD